MPGKSDKYAKFVDHPRYGRRPNFTGLDPRPTDPNVHLHWNTTSVQELAAMFKSVTGKEWPYGDLSSYSNRSKRIPNTAIAADLARQTLATVPVTHYFDLERMCRDCNRPFIFFAEEQKYWYEELGFPLESDCVRCFECRKRQRGVARQREVYESLFHVPNKTPEQLLQMASACLTLVESAVFAAKQTQRVRMLLNQMPEGSDIRDSAQFADVVGRLRALEQRGGEQDHNPSGQS